MTMSTTTSRYSYAGNGVTTVFSFPALFIKNADLVVILRVDSTGVETVKTITTHYTVSGAAVPAGGTVTMITPPATGETLTIYRDPPAVQETDLIENNSFPAETVERVFDLLTMLSQRRSDLLSRSVKLSEGVPVGAFDPTLPATLPGSVSTALVTNASGDAFDIGPTVDEISNAQQYALDAAASAAASAASASASDTSADLAEEWATRVDNFVTGSSENSSKAYAIGGTGSGQPAAGDAKSWAMKTSAAVIAGLYSAKEWAQGVLTRGLANGGSAKDWANYTGGTVDNTEYSAKKYAQDAAISAAASAASASSSQWNDVSQKVFSDSPISVVNANAGTMFEVNCTGGNVVINLPAISSLTLTGAWSIGVKKTDSSSNTITINRNGTDLIDGGTSKVISRQYAGMALIPDDDVSPDAWTTTSFGEVPVTGAIVGTSDTQTLTNKTFGDALTMTQISTPSNPSAGFDKLYFKSDDKLYKKTSAGAEIEVGSGGTLSTTTKTANYSAINTDDVILCDATGGGFIVTLPDVTTVPGKKYYIKKIDSSLNNINIDPHSSETIDGSLTYDLREENEYIQVVCDGSNWKIVSRPEKHLKLIVRRSGTQNINNSSFTTIVWDTVTLDSRSAYNNSTGELTIPTGYGGFYEISPNLEVNDNSATGFREFDIYKNGSLEQNSDYRPAGGASTYIMGRTVGIQLVETDVITIRFFQNSGGTVPVSGGGNAYNQLTVVRVGD